jgi:GDP-L-fucose synthase
MNKRNKIYLAGHNGMVGSAIYKKLIQQGYENIVVSGSKELDLRNQIEVDKFIDFEKPELVIIAAARVGGILANNTYPYQFLYDNLMIESNLINASHKSNVNNLIFLGSSCIYPKFADQPIREESLLTGSLEPTNEWYAIAKIAGVKLCQALNKQYGKKYISLMPTNLYGPRDNFDLETSHVLPAMIRKFHEAKVHDKKVVELWGSGTPMREFLHVNDLASAVFYVIENNKIDFDDLINIGTGKDITIKELAEKIKNQIGYEGEISWDSSKPDGTPRKLMDVSRINNFGWEAQISLENGISDTYCWFLENIDTFKKVEIKE